MDKMIIKNGQLIPADQACISVYNKALFFDFCVYSNIKVVQGKMFMPKLEIENLLESAQAIGMEHDFNTRQIMEWADKLVAAGGLKDALIRLLLLGPEQDSPAQLFMFPVGLTFYPDRYYRQGVKVITFKGERYLPTIKSKNLLMSYLAYRQAVEHQALDALLIDRQGNIREGTRSSFFVIKNNTLIMPPSEKILTGLTRKIILQVAPQILDVKEEDIPCKNIADYDEYFISATSMKIMPIRQIDDLLVAEEVGPKTKELMELIKNN